MIITKLPISEEQLFNNIKQFITDSTGITPDEIETDQTFKVWLGKDGKHHLAIGIQMDKLKYPTDYKYKGYLALLHNVTIMMADYTAFMGWITDINPEKL